MGAKWVQISLRTMVERKWCNNCGETEELYETRYLPGVVLVIIHVRLFIHGDFCAKAFTARNQQNLGSFPKIFGLSTYLHEYSFSSWYSHDRVTNWKMMALSVLHCPLFLPEKIQVSQIGECLWIAGVYWPLQPRSWFCNWGQCWV